MAYPQSISQLIFTGFSSPNIYAERTAFSKKTRLFSLFKKRNFIRKILAISRSEVLISFGLTLIVFAIIVAFYQELLFITFDPESAKASGIKVKRLESMLILLTAVLVVMGMKIVGLLLVTALIVIPASAGLQLAKSFNQAFMTSVLIACFSVILGLFSAFYLNLPASGAIILLASLFFLLLFCMRIIKHGPSSY